MRRALKTSPLETQSVSPAPATSTSMETLAQAVATTVLSVTRVLMSARYVQIHSS